MNSGNNELNKKTSPDSTETEKPNTEALPEKAENGITATGVTSTGADTLNRELTVTEAEATKAEGDASLKDMVDKIGDFASDGKDKAETTENGTASIGADSCFNRGNGQGAYAGEINSQGVSNNGAFSAPQASNNGAFSAPQASNNEGLGGYNNPYNGNVFDAPKAPRAEEKANAAEVLNSYLFAMGDGGRITPPKKDSAALKKLWKTVGLLVLAFVVAFSGAFMAFYWVCETALLGDSDFFRTLMLQNSGVTVNKVELDMISGSYEEDTTVLSQKVMECSVELQIYDESNKRAGSGSGVIISEDGLALTNYHVVYGHEIYLRAVLSDGTVCGVSVLHLDKITDLAVIKLDTTKKLTPAKLADSTKAKAGQSIVVCGNPVGLGFSVSFGKISHPDRNLGEVAGNYLQIDASINPGNSGGGVFDAAGNLLGIVNAKASGSNVDGIGYAIPSARVLDVTGQLLEAGKGYVSGRPAIGFTLVQVTESTWDYFNNGEDGTGGDLQGYLYESKYGIYIIESKYNDQILKGDRIVACDGTEFDNRDSFSEWLLKYKPGDEVSIVIERIVNKTQNPDGTYNIVREKKTFTCVLRERDWADEPYYK